ncbi:transmembrane sensor domain-containing protein [Brasilonema octagenarum UFV-E1]|uniref:Transmembrane sensor domain-containing protein n=2 Tax=Brasilonema TaxID=383614 RepID=A0A856MKT3_9CYAN|nr:MULTISPECIES: CHASE2 domain-containing protein [Brasilonema]NMF63039.1 transmembrane sensor domain-containing protein [Brasilonema octagenarum UFV-OR1]QDL10734.1 transmembrane sensor domain-containing protein [Brasilonema sennae CENA114]QDL17078.1 transmembrane sensor domain-containing protein [Brasilonema octagenarum UFV-E1]
MTKLIVLKLDGDFQQGFRVTLEIGAEGERPETEITGKLPSAPELVKQYSGWQATYRSLGKVTRELKTKRVRIDGSLRKLRDECRTQAKELSDRLNSWLKTESFFSIREKWLERVSTSEPVRVLICTEHQQVWQLPWHHWDLLERYKFAEIGLATLEYAPQEQKSIHENKVRILGILGNSEGIKVEEDKQQLENLPGAQTTFLVEPQRQELNDQLWEQHWDILFFAGHSQTEGERGRIYLNQSDSFSLDELRYALQTAVRGGLQFAIFNSCDGLGLAWELLHLHIPQMIVMREPVPDKVAQTFLKYFLQAFASGKPVYEAVQEARQRLQGLEDEFPCASWLPVICQHRSAVPFTWEELRASKTPVPLTQLSRPRVSLWRRAQTILAASLVVTSLVIGARLQGILQNSELKAYDTVMRLQPHPGIQDKRILVVTVNDDDVKQFGKPLSDRTVEQLLTKLEKYQPKVIGLDIYRDTPQKEGWDKLIERLRKSDRTLAICQVGESNGAPAIDPPPQVPPERLGFSDGFIHDPPNDTIRRYTLVMDRSAESPCTTPYAFSFQLIRHYLPATTRYEFNPGKNLSINSIVFDVLKPYSGGYQLPHTDMLGYQLLIDYRSPDRFSQVSLTQVLNEQDSDLLKLIKDRIVLIGYVGASTKDKHLTPLGKMPGVIVHTQMVSQILNVVLDRRPLLSPWSSLSNTVWVWGWSMVGGILTLTFCSPRNQGISIGVALLANGCICFGFFTQAVWVPLIPSALALVMTGGSVAYIVRTYARAT